MKEKIFVRGLWGRDNVEGPRSIKRLSKIKRDIEFSRFCKYQPKSMTYVWGAENYEFLKSRGIDCKLVDERPIIWDLKEQYRHKLEVLRLGIQDYSEIVLIDWDTLPVKPVPSDFWKTLGEKESFQAALRMYSTKRAFWRPKKHRRILPCASFIYLRDVDIINKIINIWENNERRSEERAIGRYIDSILGLSRWETDREGLINEYWDRFEPIYFGVFQEAVYPKEKLKSKNQVFKHFSKLFVKKFIRRMKVNQKFPDWIRNDSEDKSFLFSFIEGK